jgi:hypothetical protein
LEKEFDGEHRKGRVKKTKTLIPARSTNQLSALMKEPMQERRWVVDWWQWLLSLVSLLLSDRFHTGLRHLSWDRFTCSCQQFCTWQDRWITRWRCPAHIPWFLWGTIGARPQTPTSRTPQQHHLGHPAVLAPSSRAPDRNQRVLAPSSRGHARHSSAAE